MIDYRVGDIVIGISQTERSLYGKVFRVTHISRGGDKMVNIEDIKTGIIQKGWYAHRFELYNVDGVVDCKFCISECKKESPCGFYQSKGIEIT